MVWSFRGGKSLLPLLAHWVAPSRCCSCDEPTPAACAFCDRCKRAIEPGRVVETLHGLTVFAGVTYTGPIVRAIRRLKYDDRPELARPLGRFLADQLKACAFEGSTLVPVPLHPHRLAERRYNQAALLARAVSGALGLRMRPCALQRVLTTAHQARLSRQERAENIQGAFRATGGLEKCRVLVIDDVITTGATALACAAALREAGAAVDGVVALARAGCSDITFRAESDLA